MESVLNLMEKVDNVRKLITKEAEKVTNVFGQAALGSLFERCDDIAERIFSSDPSERESLIDVSLQEISSIESILTTTEKMTESLFFPYFKNSLFGGKKPINPNGSSCSSSSWEPCQKRSENGLMVWFSRLRTPSRRRSRPTRSTLKGGSAGL